MEDSADSYAAEARNCSELQETSTPATRQATESKPLEWTDEKHSLYLKSMEATFVNHLYKMLAQQSHKNLPTRPKLSRHKPTGVSAPSGQYKVFRFGCWSKIDFVREEPELNQVEGSGVVLSANPWIRHYKCSGRRADRKISSKATFATTANESPTHDPFQICCQDSDEGDTEVTDQNFNDNDVNLDEEKSSGLQDHVKGARTLNSTVSTADQVVPFEDITQDNDADDHGQDED